MSQKGRGVSCAQGESPRQRIWKGESCTEQHAVENQVGGRNHTHAAGEGFPSDTSGQGFWIVINLF